MQGLYHLTSPKLHKLKFLQHFQYIINLCEYDPKPNLEDEQVLKKKQTNKQKKKESHISISCIQNLRTEFQAFNKKKENDTLL